MTDVQLQSIFTYHAPHGNQASRYEQLRAAGLELAAKINSLAPESAEKTLAIRRVQEAVMYANAAIACNEPAPQAIAAPKPEPASYCGRCSIDLLGSMRVSRTDGSWRCATCDRLEFPKR